MSLLCEKTDFKPRISFRNKHNQFEIKIITERLSIYPYFDEEFENCVELYGDTENVYFFDHGRPRTRNEVRKLLNEKSAQYSRRQMPFGLFSIYRNSDFRFIGQIDLIPTSNSGVVEIGFIIAREFQNQGYCTEALKAMMYDYIEELTKREIYSISKIIATVHPSNYPSKKVIEKMGMKLEKAQNRFGQPRLWYSYFLKDQSPYLHKAQRSNENSYITA